MICSICHVAWMREHPEQNGWLKCPTCGYCAPDPKEGGGYVSNYVLPDGGEIIE